MRNYRYSFSDEYNVVGANLVLHSETDDAACVLASELLCRSKFFFVEVRDGSKIIFKVKREGFQPSDVYSSQSAAAAK